MAAEWCLVARLCVLQVSPLGPLILSALLYKPLTGCCTPPCLPAVLKALPRTALCGSGGWPPQLLAWRPPNQPLSFAEPIVRLCVNAFKCMLCYSWRTKSQPAVWHSCENQSQKTNINWRLKCQLQTSKGLFINTEVNESLNKIFQKAQKNSPQLYIHSSLLTVRNLTGVLFSALPILVLSTSNNEASKDFFARLQSQNLGF